MGLAAAAATAIGGIAAGLGTAGTAALIGGAAAIGGSLISANAAQSAANTQSQAARNAAATQMQMYQTTRGDLLPYNETGQNANAQISAMGPFGFKPTMAQLETTPGYQFTLNQGLQSTQNAAAARGLGVSGAALKGAAAYSTGLASNTYQQQFQNALSGYQTNLGKLQGQASLGENAGANTGNYGTQTAQAIGQASIGAANASAAGTVGTANAISGGLNGLGNAYLSSQYLSGMNNGGMYGNTGGGYGAIGDLTLPSVAPSFDAYGNLVS